MRIGLGEGRIRVRVKVRSIARVWVLWSGLDDLMRERKLVLVTECWSCSVENKWLLYNPEKLGNGSNTT
jgi:hypothetical protein